MHTEIFDTHELAIIVYTYYVIPGSLKLYSHIHLVSLNNLLKLLTSDDVFESTRRWLMRGENPYPGYCRAPGSNECLPLLCNCKKLKKIWLSSQNTRAKLKNTYKRKKDDSQTN